MGLGSQELRTIGLGLFEWNISSTIGVGAGDGRAASIVEWTRAAGPDTRVSAGVAACVDVVVGGTPCGYFRFTGAFNYTPVAMAAAMAAAAVAAAERSEALALFM